MSQFTHSGPAPEKVTVKSHDGRDIEVEKQIVEAMPGAYKTQAKPAEKKEAK